MSTLIAYAPNGKKITDEYWSVPRNAPATFARRRREFADDIEVAEGVIASPDYGCTNTQNDVLYRRDSAGKPLRWMCESGRLWADEDLTFKEEDE